MTNDQLLEKLYDGSLTPAEQSLLDARMAGSPEFAAEVQEFMAVVNLLDHEKGEDRTDGRFLETTREKVVALVAAAGAAGAGGAAVQSGGVSAVAGNAVQWIVAALGAAGLGGIVLWNVLSDSPSQTAPVRDVSAPVAVAPAVPAEENAAAGTVEEPAAVATQGAVQRAAEQDDAGRVAQTPADRPLAVYTPPAEPPVRTPDNDEGDNADIRHDDASVVIGPEQQADYQRELDHFKARLNQVRLTKDVAMEARVLLDIARTERMMMRYDDAEFHANQSLELSRRLGDIAGRAVAYRQLGMIYREGRRLSSAASALSKGLDLVQSAGYEETRGLLLGELAKVFRAQGNLKLAYEKMYACVVLLRQSASPALPEWESELRQLELELQ